MSTLDTTPGRTIGATTADDTVDMATVSRILRRQWWVVALITALFLGLGVAYAVVTPKTWRTSARVLLDPREKQLVGLETNRQPQQTELGWVETRLELVKSFGNLADVVKREKLTEDSEIMGTGAVSEVPDERMAVAVRSLGEMILVERPKENNLLDVSVTSKSPEKAARLAQAVAEAFVAGLARAKVDQVEAAHALLAKQTDAQRKSMLEAEARVEDYKRNNGITTTRGNLVDEETLRQSNENLVTARIKAQEAKERWEKLRAVLKSGDPAFHSQIDAVGSAVIGRLKIDAAQAARKKVEIEQEFGPLHPKARAAAVDAERNREVLLAEIRSLAATAEMDWQLAKANEDNIKKNVERAQARLADTTQATVALQELENEANARRELYKSFVARLQETTLQKSTQVSDATVVSPAQVPLKPFSPKIALALPLALALGLGVGISAALWRGRNSLVQDLARPPTGLVAPQGLQWDDRDEPARKPGRADRAEALSRRLAERDGAPRRGDPRDDRRDDDRVRDLADARRAAAREEAPASGRAGRDRGGERIGDRAGVVDLLSRASGNRRSAAARSDSSRLGASRTASADRIEAASTWAASGTSRGGAPTRVPVRVDLSLLPERVERLGAAPGPAAGPFALVETADGRVDFDGLAMLRRLGDELGHGEGPEIRVVFSNDVPTILTAALALGMARAACEQDRHVLLLDLTADDDCLGEVFDAAADMPRANRRRANPAFELRLDDHGLVLARPTAPSSDRDPTRRADRLAEFLEDARRDYDGVVVHLGRGPAAALLMEVGESADHLTAVVDAGEIDGRRVRAEIDVMTQMMPRFDGIVVLRLAADDPAFDAAEDRRRRRRG